MHDFADKPFELFIPTRLLFGCGCSALVADHVRSFGRRALFVTMPDIPGANGVRTRLEEAGIDIIPFLNVQSNPLTCDIDEAGRRARTEAVDVIVAVGGGSVIDTAKGAAVVATQPGSIWDYSLDCADGPAEVTSAALPVIALPTTAGTGAEISGIAVVTNAETHQKGPVRSPHIFPQVALVDPELTLSLPPRLTASTGFDAFTHAMERYLGLVQHPFVDAVAESAMRAIIANLETAVQDGADVSARVALSWASTQAIMAVAADVGECGLHILGLPLSARFGVSHGEGLAVLLPTLFEDICEHLPERAEWFAESFGCGSTCAAMGLKERCVTGLRQWLSRLGLRMRLADYGVTDEGCELLAAGVNLARFGNTFFGNRSRDDVRSFYLRALH